MRQAVAVLLIAVGVMLAQAVGPVPAAAHHGEGWARVVRLVDGDTFDIGVGEHTERVRLYGINAPERSDPCGPAATAALARLLTDNGRDWWVYLELGPRSADPFDRALYYLWVTDGDTWYLVDAWMASFGYARAWTRDGQYRDTIIAAEQDARTNGRGCLWGG